MGVLHYGCTTIDGDTTPWCSTQTDGNDDHVSGVGAWGYCDASCPYQGWLKQDDSKSALDPIHSSFLRDWREWIWIRPNHWIRLWINRHRIRLWVFPNHVPSFSSHAIQGPPALLCPALLKDLPASSHSPSWESLTSAVPPSMETPLPGAQHRLTPTTTMSLESAPGDTVMPPALFKVRKRHNALVDECNT